MENASKALIMAAGILIGILILSLAAYLFMDFGASSSELHNRIEEQQLTEYNAQYTRYDGRNNINIYEIITVANLAKETNDKYSEYSNHDALYDVEVILRADGRTYNLENESEATKQNLINTYSVVDAEGELTSTFLFNSDIVAYHDNGRVSRVGFIKN